MPTTEMLQALIKVTNCALKEIKIQEQLERRLKIQDETIMELKRELFSLRYTTYLLKVEKGEIIPGKNKFPSKEIFIKEAKKLVKKIQGEQNGKYSTTETLKMD